MGLKASIQGVVNKAISNSIGDLKSQATFTSVVAKDYDAASGEVSATTQAYVCDCLLTNIKQYDVADVQLAATGKKALVPSMQLGGVDVDALDDELWIDGKKYTIKSVSLDPSGALYTFMVLAQESVKFNAS